MKDLERGNFAWLPTAKQELLLKAALFENSSAVAAWQDWKRSVQMKNIFDAEIRLFPLVYHNLQKLQYTDELTGFLKTAHRTAHRNTQFRLQTTEDIITNFKDNGLRTILLKGAALGIVYYDSTALRPMADIDLLIKPADFPKALEILRSQDWRPQDKNLSVLVEIIHACQFKHDGGDELDLHWRLMRDCWNADKNDIFWEAAVPLNLNSLTAETLCPTDQLFHTCCHGARYNSISPIRWVADALMILRPPFEIDWQRLYDLGKIYGLNLYSYYALRYLREVFNAPVSEDYLRQAKETSNTRLEKMSFRLFSQKPAAWTLTRFAQEAVFQYSTQISSTTLKPRSLAFIKYLQHFMTIEKISKKLSLSNN